MKPNRIVINLGQAQPAGAGPRVFAGGQRSGGKLRWILLIIAVVLVLFVSGIAGGAYLWWRHYQSSPAYSLALLVDASQRNDTAVVDNLLDTDKVTNDFVAQVRQRLSGSALNSHWSDQLDSAISNLTPKLRETVHDQFVQELHRLTEPAAGKPFFIIALGIGQFAEVKQTDNTANVSVKVRDEHLELTMQADADRWRVIAVKDDKMAQLIADSVIKNLAPGRNGMQDEIRKQLDRFLKSGQ
jgi:flagellar basal body-associated protein FliL